MISDGDSQIGHSSALFSKKRFEESDGERGSVWVFQVLIIDVCFTLGTSLSRFRQVVLKVVSSRSASSFAFSRESAMKSAGNERPDFRLSWQHVEWVSASQDR